MLLRHGILVVRFAPCHLPNEEFAVTGKHADAALGFGRLCANNWPDSDARHLLIGDKFQLLGLPLAPIP